MANRTLHQQVHAGNGAFDRLPRWKPGFRVKLVEIMVRPAAEYRAGITISFGAGDWRVVDQPVRCGVWTFRNLKDASGRPLRMPSQGTLWLQARDLSGKVITDALIVANVDVAPL